MTAGTYMLTIPGASRCTLGGGYRLLNRVNCRKRVGEELRCKGEESFVEYFPKIGKY